MVTGNARDTIFSATLSPHRSLSPRGFLALMLAIGGLWLAVSAYFWALGAWPVFGFAGLDFLAIWLAFRINYRAALAREEVEVAPTRLTIRRVTAGGRRQELTLNPAWVRLEVEHGAESVERIVVRTRDRRIPLGAFLNPADRTSFAAAFGAALAETRR
jgi:uncharacterized membrane protein